MAEKKYANRVCPCHSYDVEGIQTWLEDLAAEGLLLEKDGPFLGILSFERTAPRRFRYRLEAVAKSGGLFGDSDSGGELQEIAAQFGWEFVCEYGAFHIFRTDDPTARELNTDPDIQTLSLKRLRKDRWVNFFCLLIQFTILFFLRRWQSFYLFRTLASVGLIGTTALVLFLLWILIKPITDIIQIARLEKNLRGGPSPASRTLSRLPESAGIFLRTLPVFLCVIGLCFWGGALINAADRQMIADYPGDPPFITVTDLIGDAAYEYTDGPMGDYNYSVQWKNAVSPFNMEWKEHVRYTSESGSHTGFIIVEYHETVSEWFAQGLADDYYRYQNTRFSDYADLDVPDMGLDSVQVFGNRVSYYVLIQHNNTVIQASIHLYEDMEKEDWLMWLEAMAQQLLNAENPDA